jgi:hypothetical protein
MAGALRGVSRDNLRKLIHVRIGIPASPNVVIDLA